MAVTISSYKAYGLYIDEPVTTRAHQVLNLVVSQAVGDVTMDLANTSGTFWTSAVGTGGNGPAAKEVMDQLIAKAESRISWCAPAIQDAKTQSAAAPATTEYRITTTSIVPSIAFFAGEAPTSVNLNLVVCLAPQQRAIRAGQL
jgi:hypothetical protein